MTEDREVLEAIERALAAGRSVALATIVRARGSTPRGVGSKMVVDSSGLTGTIGGGCGEAEVVDAARTVVSDGRARLLHIDLTEDLYSWSPAICGGVFEVLIEPISASRDAHGDIG